MNGQVLDYQLTLNSGSFVAGSQKAATALASINPAPLTTLNNTIKSTNTSLRAMENLMGTFGSQMAPQYANAVITVTSSLTALKTTAAAANVSMLQLGAAGAVILGVSLSLDLVSDQYGKMLNRLEEARGLTALQHQIPRALNSLTQAFKEGKVSVAEYEKQLVSLSKANGPAQLHKLLTQTRAMADRGVYRDAKTIDARQGFSLKMEGLEAQLEMNPFERQRKEAVLDFKREALVLQKEALAAKVSFSDFMGPLEARLNNKLESINSQEQAAAAPKAAAPKATTLRATPVTELERIGFVFNRGGFAATDFNRETAQNTKLIAQYTKQMAEKATDNNFANQ